MYRDTPGPSGDTEGEGARSILVFAVRSLVDDARVQLANTGRIEFAVGRLEADTPAGRALRSSAEHAAAAMGLRVLYEAPPGRPDSDGQFRRADRTIYVNPALSSDDQALTLAHEVAHGYAHWIGQASGGSGSDNRLEELSAEIAAHALAATHGLDTTVASAPYVFQEGFTLTSASYYDPKAAVLRPMPVAQRLDGVMRIVSAGQTQGVDWAKELLRLAGREE